MAALQSKGYHYQEHCQIIYIKNLPNFLYTTNQSGPVTMSDVLPWDLIKFQSSEIGAGSFFITKRSDIWQVPQQHCCWVPVKFQGDWTILNTNLTALTLHENLW